MDHHDVFFCLQQHDYVAVHIITQYLAVLFATIDFVHPIFAYRSKKPLIITTNLTLSELNNAADIAHKRIYDRILERCVPIRINNRNIRQDNATANLKKTKKILLDNHTSNQS